MPECASRFDALVIVTIPMMLLKEYQPSAMPPRSKRPISETTPSPIRKRTPTEPLTPPHHSTSIASPFAALFSVLTHSTKSSMTLGQLLSSLQNPKLSSFIVCSAKLSVCFQRSLLMAFLYLACWNSIHQSSQGVREVRHSKPTGEKSIRQNSTASSGPSDFCPDCSAS